MSILESSTVQDRKRLLELFPIINLRQAWSSLKGTKEELCYSVAEQQPVQELIQFLDEHLSCCKQHVYVCSRPGSFTALPVSIEGGEKVFDLDGDHALYIIRSRYSIILRDPLEDATLEFLWPVRLEITKEQVIVRFVVLEKNISSYFERPYYISDRSVDEKSVLKSLTEKFSLQPIDLHKGIKKLWVDGFMDSTRTEYKKPISTAKEAMDEERGIREHNPELYEVLLESPLFNTLFALSETLDRSVSVFSVDPSRGYIAFPRYSETSGDTDFVVREILKHN
jgi:hypothetical protein